MGSGDELRGPLREAQRHIDRERPCFLWVRYFDPHAPYDRKGPKLPEFLGAKPDHALLSKVCSLATAEQFQTPDLEHEPELLTYAKACYDSDVRVTGRLIAMPWLSCGSAAGVRARRWRTCRSRPSESRNCAPWAICAEAIPAHSVT